MGGKSGGGASTPYEAPNTLSSAQSLRIVDAISEGVVSGFANGNDAPFKSVFFNDTPVQNPDGSYNFKGVIGFFQRGTPDQSYIPGFDASERTVAVAAQVKNSTPIVRAVTDGLVNRLRVTVGVERNAEVKNNGDTVPATTQLVVELLNAGGLKAAQTVTFTEKSSGVYYQDIVFDNPPAAPFNIRVSRPTADPKTDKISNKTYFSSYVEIIDVKMVYPHTALAALSIDSDQFGSSVPTRNYLLKGRLVRVPSNYDPETRTYSSGTWDGSFKSAWTNNPAWIFYDALSQPRISTIARRLNVADIDKWTLYQVARYCDELVDDGFGGKEPRFVCNAYITNEGRAAEFLTNLSSVFTGLPVWNGNQVSVVMDADSDPVALYNNASVKDGLFTYAGAAMKGIHTAVHVQYVDKHDGYRSKTEYVADDEAIARYGLNIKSVVAFGCDSRGQAARFGAWTLQTELRQQNAVSFTVGREGLKHLPYDIIQIMDNQYAGAELSGRLNAISDNTLTLDRDVTDAVGAMLYFTDVSGEKPVLSSVKVTAAKGAVLTVERAPAMAVGDTWILSGKVKPRLYRAIGIKENTDEGTYTISALLHDPKKYEAVDKWANFEREITTLHTLEPVLVNGDVKAENGAVILTWDNLTASGQVLTYDIKIYRNNQLYRHTPDAKTAEIRLENLPNGNYRAEIRGRNARGILSEPLIKAWSIDYNITGLRTTPKTLAIAVDWVLPQTVVSELVSELWYSKTNDIQTATKLAALPYPQNSYQLTGVSVVDTYYFWVRAVDASGNAGEFTAAVMGQADKDPAPIVQQVQGAITQSALSKDLIASLNGDMQDAADKAVQAEAAARVTAIKQATDAQAKLLTDTAAAIGTRVTKIEEVNTNQSRDLSTLTAKMDAVPGAISAGVEAERKARVTALEAETGARQLLATRVNDAEGAIRQEATVRAAADKQNSDNITSLTGRMGNVEAGVTRIEQTQLTRQQAEAMVTSQLNARFQIPDTRNDNQPPSWYWDNYPKQTATEFKSVAAMGISGVGGFGVLTTDVAWVNPSGSAIQQVLKLPNGKIYRRTSDVLYTYSSAGGYTITRDTWAAWAEDETVMGAQAKADVVKAIAEATDRFARQTDADFRQFTRTYATDQSAAATRVETLSAEIKNIGTGGRNLLRNSGASYSSAAYGTRYALAEAPSVGEDVVVTLWGDLGADRTGIGVYNSAGFVEIARLVKIADGVYRSVGKWAKPVRNGVEVTPNDTHLNVYFYPNTGTSVNTIRKIQLERGTVGSDWTAAPEDVEADTAARVQTVSSTVATLDGKVQAMHSLKVEAISGGRKAIAGVAMGADGNTGDSQFLVYSNKFGLVEPGSKDIVTPYVTVIKNGKATTAMTGDFIADGTVHGRSIVAGTEIITPVLQSAIVNAGRINSTEINNGNGNLTITADGVLRAKHGYFEGTVRADRIEGVLVDLLTSDAPVESTSYSSPTRSVYKTYWFVKDDVRPGIVIISPVDAVMNIQDSSARQTSVVARVYLNDILVFPRKFTVGTDGVDRRDVTCGLGLSGALNFPAFRVGAGRQVFRVEIYGFVSTASSVTLNLPNRLTALVGY